MRHILSFLFLFVSCIYSYSESQSEYYSGTVDGHDYVDLGLQSGTLWATCNIGAYRPEQYGNYYAWGETETKTIYTSDNFKWNNIKYDVLKQKEVIDSKGNLTNTYDVASVKWGDEWRMPTLDEIKELKECGSKTITVNGKEGKVFIGNNGNKLFLPFAGNLYKDRVNNADERGDYWSATANGSVYAPYRLFINLNYVGLHDYYNGNGLTVRPVLRTKYSFDSTTPPNLEITGSLSFTDTDNNNAIDASESCSIDFEVKNSGKGAARSCVVKIRTKEAAQYLTFSELRIDVIEAGKSKKVSVPIKAGMNTADGSVTFVVSVYEPNGFGTDEYEITVPTRAFVAPLVLVQDYAVSTEAGSMIKKKQAFDLQLLIQNTKNGNANDVTVSVELPQNVMLMETSGKEKIGTLDGGDTATVTYTLIATNNYQGSTIPIKVNLKEKYGKYAQSKTITLDMNQSIANNKVVVAANATNNNKEIKNVSIGSDVDKDIPQSQAKSPNTFVLIIANENYTGGIESVPYARNDGEVFRQYCVKTLGIPNENIEMVADGTYGSMANGIDWIEKVIKTYKGAAKVIFYYAGHGIPDEATKSACLLPVDGNPHNQNTLYKLDDLYSKLGGLESKSVTVFLDACFSGSARGNGMIASARGVVVSPKKGAPQGRMVVLSATTGDQTAMPYDEQKHGLFTYYLLKKLQETKGNATMGEIAEYVGEQVSRKSIVVNKKAQNPTVNPSAKAGDWKQWKMK